MLNIIIKGCSLTLLPECIIYFYYSFLGKILKIFGSICVIICLFGFNINYIYGYILIKILASVYLSLLILLSFVKISYGFYMIYYTYNIDIYTTNIFIYFIVLFRIIIIFLLDILGFSVLEGSMEILMYIYNIRSDLYTFYKRILKMFL